MKILSIPLSYFITAIVVGIALSFLLASTVFAPHMVDTHPQEVTPVPTPKEIYVYVHTDSPDEVEEAVEDSVEDNVNTAMFFAVSVLGAIAIITPVIVFLDD